MRLSGSGRCAAASGEGGEFHAGRRTARSGVEPVPTDGPQLTRAMCGLAVGASDDSGDRSGTRRRAPSETEVRRGGFVGRLAQSEASATGEPVLEGLAAELLRGDGRAVRYTTHWPRTPPRRSPAPRPAVTSRGLWAPTYTRPIVTSVVKVNGTHTT